MAKQITRGRSSGKRAHSTGTHQHKQCHSRKVEAGRQAGRQAGINRLDRGCALLGKCASRIRLGK